MGKPLSEIPVVYQFINLVQKGFAALDNESQAQVKQFVQKKQLENGGFVNRAGHADLYYSLFGIWIASGIGLEEELEKHRQFVLEKEPAKTNLIDDFALLIIRLVLFQNKFPKPSVFKLIRTAFLTRHNISFYYRIFLFLLTFDVFYSKNIIQFFGRIVLPFLSPPAGSPCSVYAAVLVARQKVGLKTEKEVKNLLNFFDEEKGFKTFREVAEADLLSTAVALFALKFTSSDLRLVSPACLELLQQNFSNGAFLAGNGDEMRDLEYTFYGLLALGILI